MACWDGSVWVGDGVRYPMRFRPDLYECSYDGACVMHPLKECDGKIRLHHRSKRMLTFGGQTDIIRPWITN